MCYHSGFMLQFLLQEHNCKTPYLTRQLYAVTGYFLTTDFSKHMVLCTCIFYKVKARSWPACVHLLAVPPTAHRRLAPTQQPPCVPATTLPCLSGGVFPQPTYFGGGSKAMCAMEAWCGDTERQQDTTVLCSPAGDRALPAPAWFQAGVGSRICASLSWFNPNQQTGPHSHLLTPLLKWDGGGNGKKQNETNNWVEIRTVQ